MSINNISFSMKPIKESHEEGLHVYKECFMCKEHWPLEILPDCPLNGENCCIVRKAEKIKKK